jgi:N-acyl-D-amino-acid deacylase
LIRFCVALRGGALSGMLADLVLFHPATEIDRSTFEGPQRRSEGIEKVYAGGVLVRDHDYAAGARPGRVRPH